MLRFIAPLAATNVIVDVAEQFITSGIVRSSMTSVESTDALAGFTLGLYVSKLLSSAQFEAKSVSANLGACRSVLIMVLTGGILSGALHAIVSLSSVGPLLFGTVHRAPPRIASQACATTLLLSGMPLLEGLARVFVGELIRRRCSGVASTASMVDIVLQMVVILIGVALSAAVSTDPAGRAADHDPAGATHEGAWSVDGLGATQVSRPVWIACGAMYAGVLGRLATVSAVLLVQRKSVDRTLRTPPSGAQSERVSFADVLRFWWPITFVQLCQSVARPLLNLFVSRSSATNGAGPEALAALAVCYPVAHTLYGWLNETKSLPAAFAPSADAASLQRARQILRCCVACHTLSLVLMLLAFWTPLHVTFLRRVIGVQAGVVMHATPAFRVYTFITIPVSARAYWSGWAAYHRRTHVLAPSAFARLGTVVAAVCAFSAMGVEGAVLAIASLLASFVAESATVVVCCKHAGIAPAYATSLDAKGTRVGARQCSHESMFSRARARSKRVSVASKTSGSAHSGDRGVRVTFRELAQAE